MKWTKETRPRLGDTKQVGGETLTVRSIYQGGVVCNAGRVFTAAEWVAL